MSTKIFHCAAVSQHTQHNKRQLYSQVRVSPLPDIPLYNQAKQHQVHAHAFEKDCHVQQHCLQLAHMLAQALHSQCMSGQLYLRALVLPLAVVQAGKQRVQRVSLAETHPELAAQWHPTKNDGKQPADFTAGCGVKVWWICSNVCASCGRPHVWEAKVYIRASDSRPRGCPFCSGHKCCECSSLAAQRPDLMREWDWEANAELDPRQISLGSNRRLAWSCSRHGTWVARVRQRVRGSGCRKCAIEKRGKRVPRDLLWDEHPELVKQLHPTKNAHIDLDKVTSGSSKKAVWVCTECQDDPPGCPHPREWEATIQSRTSQGVGCPYCSGHKVCPCKSLARLVPAVAVQWHPTKNRDNRPDQFAQFSSQSVWWQHTCKHTKEVHEWQAHISDRVVAWQKMRLLSCPLCASLERRGLFR